MLDGQISTCFNKDTFDLFMLCMVLICQLHHVFFYYCCLIYFTVVRFILLLFDHSFVFYSSFVDFCSFDYFCFDSTFIVHCSLENIQFWSWIVFQVFRSRCTRSYHHHLCKSISIIHQTAQSLSYYRSEWPIKIIDIEGYSEPIFSKTKLQFQRARH
jgi:hypothetical protein